MAGKAAAPKTNTAQTGSDTGADEGTAAAQAGNGADTTEATETGAPALETGLKKAEDYLATLDEDVTLLWHVGGPKHSRIDRVGQFLISPPGAMPTKLICVSMKSGGFQFYAPAQIAPAAPAKEEVAEEGQTQQ